MFVRGLMIASAIAGSVSLAAGCGSAPDSELFSPSTHGAGRAGANNARAGASATGGNEHVTAGSSNGGGGNASNGDAGESNGSSGASAGGTSSGEAGKAGDVGEAGAGAPGGGAAGSSAGGAGAGGSSVAGAGAGGAALGGAGPGGGAGGGGPGSGGSVGAGTGGTSNGGTSSGGAGGANGCPALAPVEKAECNVSTPSSCFYPGEACSCLATGLGPAGPRRWACYGTPDKCPKAKPTAGISCKQNVGAECPYSSQDYCICKGDGLDASWTCQAPTATCLASKPPQNLACSSVRSCQYSDVSCFCNSNNWSCLGG